jgi:hypothetical protein
VGGIKIKIKLAKRPFFSSEHAVIIINCVGGKNKNKICKKRSLAFLFLKIISLSLSTYITMAECVINK